MRSLPSGLPVGVASRRRLAGAFIVAIALLGLSAEAASGQAVRCGQVLTRDVRLQADLVCPVPGPGLVIGADRVTVDLDGHEIIGLVLAGGGGGIGIDNTGGFDRVTVHDGTIRGFGRGIVLTGASHNWLLDVNISGVGSDAVVIAGGQQNTIRNSTLMGRFLGLGVSGSDRISVVGNTANGFFAGAMSLTSNFGLIAHNRTGTTNTGSISVSGSSNRLAHNQIRGSLDLLVGTANVVVRNWIVAGVDGIFVSPSATGTTLRRNVAAGNADDGIDVESASTVLVRNTANDNGDLGIEAVSGVADFGNRAAGNGNPFQCLNVSCG
jgi:parallel beta-helix repeat protein